MTIDELIHCQDTISSAPQTASKMDRLLKRSSDLDEIVEVAQYDPGLTARILQVCNSAAYRGRLPISSLKEAIARLGKCYPEPDRLAGSRGRANGRASSGLPVSRRRYLAP